MNLERVAVRISHDLKEVVFIGAFAVVSYIGPYRRTGDIDLALGTPMSDEQFEKLGYRILIESGKKIIRTPEGIKMDVYTRDVSGIPVPKIFETAVPKQIRFDQIKIICLEALLIAKIRAGRPQDIEDVQELCRRRGKLVRWEVVDSIAEVTESAELKNVVSAFSR